MWIDDKILQQAHEHLTVSCWVPASPMVVLGSSNSAVTEVARDNCARDLVPILKRYGGGGTVLLHQGCLIISLGLWVQQHFQNALYFRKLNDSIISALAKGWPRLGQLGQRGISDITWQDRKVGGTSLFRSRNYLLYQASLLIDARLDLIAKYLRHPSREPDYRQGRSHSEFLVGLNSIEPSLEAANLAGAAYEHLPDAIREHLKGELIDAQIDQIEVLKRRAERGREELADSPTARFVVIKSRPGD